jgi:serine O-acetyltransferase
MGAFTRNDQCRASGAALFKQTSESRPHGPGSHFVKGRYSRIKRISGYGTLLALAQRILGSPHYLLMRWSPGKTVIESDIQRWSENNFPNLEERISVRRAFALLLWNYPEFRSLLYYRIQSHEHFITRILLVLCSWIYRPLSSLYFYTPTIGEGLYIQHGFSTVIAAERIGDHCWINQQVTVGWDDNNGCPTIGNNVRIATGAVVFGKISIGDNVVIGANALVCKNVPANCTVVGVPAFIVKRDGKPVREEL